MSRTITVELSNESINHAIRELRAYRQRLEDGVSQFCQRLAELGAEILNVTYSNATYAGTNDITVSVEPGTNVATLKADGSTVAFIEFGTGVNYPIGQYAGQAGAPPHGSYGKHHGATGKTWTYHGSPGTSGQHVRGDVYRTDGNPPADAFPAAVNNMSNEYTRIAREVWANL